MKFLYPNRPVLINQILWISSNIKQKHEEEIWEARERGPKRGTKDMWKIKVKIVPMVIEALWIVIPKLKKEWLQQTQGTTSKISAGRSKMLVISKIFLRRVPRPLIMDSSLRDVLYHPQRVSLCYYNFQVHNFPFF